ncbi:hypothetical protein BACCIP111883_02008 [Sutcliffiella rhizosphaerae]|uniref:Uncharacterized protein n=1 Tax=Sutcliffiella rhizosphaerae TaxID=2880967 RepID=A0ABM8YMP4_9BACI|nr:hypothetical protein BACCIP111883_02008 [Sutcliffiella rhizosphaerae]
MKTREGYFVIGYGIASNGIQRILTVGTSGTLTTLVCHS